MIIKDILIPGLTTLSCKATMQEAHNLMLEKGFRHLPISDGTSLIGILSDRDVNLAMVLGADGNRSEGHIHAHKLVTEFMTSPVLKASLHESVSEMVREMLNLKVSCFIIEDDKGLDIGIITTEDLLIAFLDLMDKETTLFTRLKTHFQDQAKS